MSDRIMHIKHGPYATSHGTYIIAEVMGVDGIYEEEIFYSNMEDCMSDIAELVANGWVDLDPEDEEFEEVDYD